MRRELFTVRFHLIIYVEEEAMFEEGIEGFIEQANKECC
jgi:hypothetical protein